jgi:hypothetical protein
MEKIKKSMFEQFSLGLGWNLLIKNLFFCHKNMVERLVDRAWCGLAWVLGIRVSDLYSFYTDPDPAF